MRHDVRMLVVAVVAVVVLTMSLGRERCCGAHARLIQRAMFMG